MYGNYLEGYENIDVDAEAIANYHDVPDIYDLTIELLTVNSTSGTYRDFTVDYTNLPSSVSQDSKIAINVFIDFEDILIAGGSTEHINLSANELEICLLYTSPSPRDGLLSRMPSSA